MGGGDLSEECSQEAVVIALGGHNGLKVTWGMGDRREISVLCDLNRTWRLTSCKEREQKGWKGPRARRPH